MALRIEDGEAAWRDRSIGKGSLICAEGRLYAFGEGGEMALVAATPEAYKEHGRLEIESGPLPTYALPVIANGRLYLREQDTLYAFSIRERK
jgi:outer membrane protein assembly factor BamB